MVLSDGEKMVWAAAFVSKREKVHKDVISAIALGSTSFSTIDVKEAGCHLAIQEANIVVEELRKIMNVLQKERIDDPILKAMLGDNQ